MKTIFKLFVTIVVFVATTTAVNEGDESLMKILAKERKEMREIFQRENERLEKQDEKLQQQVTKQTEENAKQNQEIVKQNQMQQQQQQVIAKLQDQNRKLHQKLRHAELESKKAARQNDQREKLNMKRVIKTELLSRGRNDSLELELKKFVKAEIHDFLITERICVGGEIKTSMEKEYGKSKKVDFGYTFPRKPTFVASVGRVQNYDGEFQGVYFSTSDVTNTSAVLYTYKRHSDWYMRIEWLACL